MAQKEKSNVEKLGRGSDDWLKCLGYKVLSRGLIHTQKEDTVGKSNGHGVRARGC